MVKMADVRGVLSSVATHQFHEDPYQEGYDGDHHDNAGPYACFEYAANHFAAAE